ncbi:hypothetical protein ACLKA6_001630 [Drosophila palustris]
MCIDYRQLNANSIPDAYPLPRIHHILERLRNARYISTLDLKSGYWQIPMARGSREYTAFTVPGRGLFHWKVMPFGLHSAPATFQRALDSVIGPDMEPYAFAYLDDIIVSGASLEEHVRNLGEVLRRLRQANLRLNRAKCKFFRRSLVYLGHVISGEGIHTDPDKIAAVRELQPPTTCRELRRCLGIASWYRRFVPNFADIVQPMSLLLKKGQNLDWKPEQQAAFEELKARLTEAPVLACPDFSEKFVLQTDASDCGLGAVLTEQHQGAERVAYVSRRLVKAEENYSATEKECLAIVWAIRKLRCYLEGYRFDVVTDHLALKWLNSIDNPTGRIARWALELQQYQFDIHYRRGKQNIVADALSRQPLEVILQMAQEEEPNCKWITRLTKRILEAPDRFPDFTIEGSQVYRHLGHRPEEEDYVPWKLCHGNTMLLVFFDAFTKWVELIPLRKATSAHLERAFREAILSSKWAHPDAGWPTWPTSKHTTLSSKTMLNPRWASFPCRLGPLRAQARTNPTDSAPRLGQARRFYLTLRKFYASTKSFGTLRLQTLTTSLRLELTPD